MPKVVVKKVRSKKSLDTETSGKDLRHGSVPFFITSCNEAGEISYWETSVNPLTRKSEWTEEELAEIQEYLNGDNDWVFQNEKFDITALNALGLVDNWDWTKTWDTLLAGHLLASNQPHDLTTMSLVYMGINIKPLEDALKEACNAARRLARSKYPTWRIAKEGLPEIPSCKSESADKSADGTPRSTPWANDMWLPRAIAKHEWEASEAFAMMSPQLMEMLPTMAGWDWRPPSDKWEGHHPWWTVLRDYSNADSEVTLKLFAVMEEELKLRGLWKIYLERLKILPVVYNMESKGITLSEERLNELREDYTEGSKKSAQICVNLATSYGYELSLPKSGNNNSLIKFCFGDEEQKHLDLPVVQETDTGNPSLNAAAIKEYLATLNKRSKQYKFVEHLSAKRSRDTAIAYMEGYQKYWLDKDECKVLYPSLNPTGTATLRFSSSNPNQQNISKKEGFNLRYMFGPAEGREWWSLDYENIELRIPAYEAGEEAMIELFEKPNDPPYFGSYHLLNASIVYPDLFWPLAEQKDEFKSKYKSTWYQWCKNGTFARQYGAQEAKVDATYKKKGSFQAIQSKLQKVNKLTQHYIDMANKYGYVETIPDKTVDPVLGYPVQCVRSTYGRIKPTIPFSYHVQSTAMACTAKAMVRCHSYLSKLKDCWLALQVHDEIVIDLPQGKEKNYHIVKEVKRLMEKSGEDIGIPLRVSVAYHENNWSEEEKIEV